MKIALIMLLCFCILFIVLCLPVEEEMNRLYEKKPEKTDAFTMRCNGIYYMNHGIGEDFMIKVFGFHGDDCIYKLVHESRGRIYIGQIKDLKLLPQYKIRADYSGNLNPGYRNKCEESLEMLRSLGVNYE